MPHHAALSSYKCENNSLCFQKCICFSSVGDVWLEPARPAGLSGRELSKARTIYVLRFMSWALFQLMGERPMTSYMEVVNQHFWAWGLNLDQVVYLHTVFYELIVDHQLWKRSKEVCLSAWSPPQCDWDGSLVPDWMCDILEERSQCPIRWCKQNELLQLRIAHVQLSQILTRFKRALLARLNFN